MIDRLRHYVRRWTTTTSSSDTYPSDHARAAAEKARGDRAGEVMRLQREVRELQQRIADLSDARDQSVDPQERKRQSDELESLYRSLTRTQGELAKFQARV